MTLPKVGGVGRFSCFQRKPVMNLRSQRLIPPPVAQCSSYFDNILQIQVKIGDHLQFWDSIWALPFTLSIIYNVLYILCIIFYIIYNVLYIYIHTRQAFTASENCQCLALARASRAWSRASSHAGTGAQTFWKSGTCVSSRSWTQNIHEHLFALIKKKCLECSIVFSCARCLGLCLGEFSCAV